MENSLTAVPKNERLVLMSTVQIAKDELNELAGEINRFAEKIRQRYGKGDIKEFYQIVMGATPFR